MTTARIGRPVGSTNGRVPKGGYPDIDPELGGFLAGFIEGEASFAIRRQAGYECHGCGMSLKVRADDRDLVRSLRDKTQLGTVGGRPPRSTSKPQVHWGISAKSDCRRLAQILDRYPLRGQKSRAYAIWRGALEWWIGTDPRDRKHGCDWEPMAYFKERLSEANQYNRRPIDLSDGTTGLASDWASYLSGFATAEGHFGVRCPREKFMRPRFVIRLRADDRVLLDALCDRTGAGRVYGPYAERGRKSPAFSWTVFSRADLLRLVEVFDRSPPKGRKRKEFEIWRKAVLVAQADRSPAVEAELRELGARLHSVRSFKGS